MSYLYSEVRWVETSLVTAYIQRRWLTQPPEVSVDWVNVESEYGVILTLPQPSTDETVADNIKRIESLWINMSFDGLPVPEDLAVELGLGSLRESIYRIDQYLDENPIQ